jgi:hypothetical protein
MAGIGNKFKELSLGEDFGDVTVKANGIVVDIHADGTIEHYTILERRQRLANDVNSPATAEPKPGDKMRDGIYAGISPETGKAMFTTPADGPLTYTFNEAQKYVQTANAGKLEGHDDWRVPTKAELNVLFNNRTAVGGFNVSGSYADGLYWSASPDTISTAWGQRFSDGSQFYNIDKATLDLSVRCVR